MNRTEAKEYLTELLGKASSLQNEEERQLVIDEMISLAKEDMLYFFPLSEYKNKFDLAKYKKINIQNICLLYEKLPTEVLLKARIFCNHHDYLRIFENKLDEGKLSLNDFEKVLKKVSLKNNRLDISLEKYINHGGNNQSIIKNIILKSNNVFRVGNLENRDCSKIDFEYLYQKKEYVKKVVKLAHDNDVIFDLMNNFDNFSALGLKPEEYFLNRDFLVDNFDKEIPNWLLIHCLYEAFSRGMPLNEDIKSNINKNWISLFYKRDFTELDIQTYLYFKIPISTDRYIEEKNISDDDFVKFEENRGHTLFLKNRSGEISGFELIRLLSFDQSKIPFNKPKTLKAFIQALDKELDNQILNKNFNCSLDAFKKMEDFFIFNLKKFDPSIHQNINRLLDKTRSYCKAAEDFKGLKTLQETEKSKDLSIRDIIEARRKKTESSDKEIVTTKTRRKP